MPHRYVCDEQLATTIPLYLIPRDAVEAKQKSFGTQSSKIAKIAKKISFTKSSNQPLLCYDAKGDLQHVVMLLSSHCSERARDIAVLCSMLPAGDYHFAELGDDELEKSLIEKWLRCQYSFQTYLSLTESPQKILRICPRTIDVSDCISIIEAEFYACNLINTPANDLGPHCLEEEARLLANEFDAEFRSYVGDELLIENFPLIHAVGAGSHRLPRLVEFCFGEPSHPCVTLIGKGVNFDSGGLNIKPSNAMRHMKKDMAGAASVMALARRIMRKKLPLRLQVLLPCIENSISSMSYRPGDIYSSRAGLSVEVGHTDAEGRLILADSISYATEFSPDLIIVMATLTGASRVAVGPDIVPYYTNDEKVNRLFEKHCHANEEDFLRFPLYSGYNRWLKSRNADICSISSIPFADSIMAALFLQRFANNCAFMHFDIYAWQYEQNQAKAQAIKTLYAFLQDMALAKQSS